MKCFKSKANESSGTDRSPEVKKIYVTEPDSPQVRRTTSRIRTVYSAAWPQCESSKKSLISTSMSGITTDSDKPSTMIPMSRTSQRIPQVPSMQSTTSLAKLSSYGRVCSNCRKKSQSILEEPVPSFCSKKEPFPEVKNQPISDDNPKTSYVDTGVHKNNHRTSLKKSVSDIHLDSKKSEKYEKACEASKKLSRHRSKQRKAKDDASPRTSGKRSKIPEASKTTPRTLVPSKLIETDIQQPVKLNETSIQQREEPSDANTEVSSYDTISDYNKNEDDTTDWGEPRNDSAGSYQPFEISLRKETKGEIRHADLKKLLNYVDCYSSEKVKEIRTKSHSMAVQTEFQYEYEEFLKKGMENREIPDYIQWFLANQPAQNRLCSMEMKPCVELQWEDQSYIHFENFKLNQKKNENIEIPIINENVISKIVTSAAIVIILLWFIALCIIIPGIFVKIEDEILGIYYWFSWFNWFSWTSRERQKETVW